MQSYDAAGLATECWYLTGPTAAGKTRLGLELARQLDAEIISLDSMAIYRGMDIGTAKPTADEQAAVPHHLIDIVEPDQEYSVAQYVDAAAAAARQIGERGKQVLFVGGTPLYLKALLRGIFEGPPADWEFREQVSQELAGGGTAALHERLCQVDPVAASRLHPNDARRIIRALEVHHLTGRPISQLQTQFEQGRPAEQCKVFVLDWPRGVLHRRINDRVEQMMRLGFVNEVQRLLDRYPRPSRTASQAVGYREMIDHFGGAYDLKETVGRIKRRTRQFAKRQGTWFRSLSECRHLMQQQERKPAEVAGEIIAACNG
jgi:tRNA dimethylallyltransferase